MSKYEIMLIIDPNSDDKVLFEIAKSTFKKTANIEKLERTELAYEINKSKTAIYYLITVEATGNEINEFMRKANIVKNIWRSLSVNLDHERGLNRKAKPKRIRKPFVKKYHSSDENENKINSTETSTLEPHKKESKLASKKDDTSKKIEKTLETKVKRTRKPKEDK